MTSGKESACHKGEAGLISPLHQKDLLEKEVAIYSIILAWEIPWTEESGRLLSIGLQKVRQDPVTKQQQKQQILN